jgi:hypothetical protein
MLRKILLMSLALAAQVGAAVLAQNAHGKYVGVWSLEKNVAGQSAPYSTFELDIDIRGSDVIGRYCYMTQFGNKIDCGPSDPSNIHGSVRQDETLQVDFSSFSGTSGGKAIISKEGGKLLWKVVQNPVGDGFYGPEQAELSKQSPANDGENGQASGNIKITSDKAYLFNGSSENLKTKSYLIKGDDVRVIGYSLDKNYIHINYLSKKAGVLDKWIRCENASSCTQ